MSNFEEPPRSLGPFPIPGRKAIAAYIDLISGVEERSRSARNRLSESPELVDELVELGFLSVDAREEDREFCWNPVNPRLVEARLGMQWRSSALELLENANRLSECLSSVFTSSDTLDIEPRAEQFTLITGKSLIRARISQAMKGCARELLSAQPGGTQPENVLRWATDEVPAVLKGGASAKILYQHAVRHEPATCSFVSDITDLGAEVRTIDEIFDRLLIIDDTIAFIFTDADQNSSLMTSSPELIKFLKDIFEVSWSQARSFTGNRNPKESAKISDSLRNAIIRHLIDGKSDTVIAQRIGVSLRSYASHIARIKEEFDVDTRFQLGYKLALLHGHPDARKEGLPQSMPSSCMADEQLQVVAIPVTAAAGSCGTTRPRHAGRGA